MPIYDYQCPKCSHFLAKKKSIYRASEVEYCPECTTAMRKLYSAPTIIYKGSGFYNTDHPKGS